MSWPMVALGEFFPKRNPSVDPKKFVEETFELFSIPAYDSGEAEIVSGADIGSSKKAVQPGDVLLARIVPHIRRCWVVPQERGHRQIGSGEWIVVRTNKFDPNFLRHFLLSDDFHAQFMQTVAGVGGSLLRARPADVGLIQVPLPPLDEQKRIAAILDKADALRRAREQSVVIASKFSSSLFQSMFGDWRQERSDLPVVELGDHLTRLTSGSRGWAKYYADSGSAFIRIQNVRRDSFDRNDLAYVSAPENAEARRTAVAPGDVLMSITADLGRTAVVPDDLGPAHINQHLVVMSSNDFVPRFLSAAIASPSGQHFVMKRNREAVKAGLNFDDVRSIKVVLPPLNDQEEFARLVQKGERMIAHLNGSTATLSNLFNTLQHRAFVGEL